LPARYLSGTAAAVSVGVINSFGNLGGFFGPYIMGKFRDLTHSFVVGMSTLIVAQIIGGLFVFVLRPPKAMNTASPVAG
jgi:ACS family tartrate transporter-like MFS transporter